ncbi:MAG: hypothetical protein UR85_C0002G0071 [Candidatus Nomurabacteria bacterium GW2011_GWF2_35_66]|uniref:Uncharacterized protein n=1 Tax=Candidatus Nomurabacteria bacterium GW2011_GWE1_35_16 TaxID=1618761 RepID=A0A0G0DUH0_9BACT|nr:MAG: hypothetical protein UR55_C0004G0031 [Candidatus Nomurabacteria bacterium GW2011_GWF1_34_20]KKP63470.1 MAG: hypothetical protein UR57_C0004G0031 [Candidatus Nomurabacteria bacterium GW2011_GWE2_34_25]KKP66650.1 MAG: hypothetical protein UR64_C0004G0031 [Candidatus Nomurabacteria bacterium GW2011_GWE1_35_16]KKP83758.1 MAG: hypothetical protein UR85_C0002G0071 [Candidatus Nomurabacteria bacterium GW2011_GWF2_35_66]HAE36449.1 hypothetical protein [Candidatus Nomurabacteria bacterium]
MENKPKKSKAFIITFILILLLLIAGYFLLFKDGGIMNSSSSSARLFSSLLSSKDPDESNKTLALAGEEIKDKNSIYVSGYVEKTETVAKVFKVDINDPNSSDPNNIYGIANQDISINLLGRVTITDSNRQNKRIIAQGGEDLKEGDEVYISTYTKYKKQIPIVMNMVNNDPSAIKNNNIFGFANQNIRNDNIGEVTLTNSSTSNTFWDSFFGFLGKKTAPKIEKPVIINPQINSENGEGKGDGVGGWEKIDPYRFPVVTVTSTPSSFEREGVSTISWTSTDSNTCSAGPGNGTGTTGSFSTGLLKKSKMFSVVCTGENGTSGGNAFVIIGSNRTFPTVTVTANPSSFEREGMATISWTSTDTVSCNAGIGNGTGTTGSFSTGLLTTSKSFAVTCTGINGSIGGSTSVIVVSNDNNSAIRQCSDGIDNDDDGKSDKDDPNCHLDGDLNKEYVPSHFSETTSPNSLIAQCNDDIDNDGDGKTDEGDTSCHLDGNLAKAYIPTHFSETTFPLSTNAQCSDGIDNDGDKVTDVRDPQCHTDGDVNNINSYLPTHFSEAFQVGDGKAQCSDGKDNDKDTKADALDPQCHIDGDLNKEYVPSHFSEAVQVGGGRAQCSDGTDNDGDGKIDVEDLNCHEGGVITGKYLPTHFSEKFSPADGVSQCADTKDNDGDKLIDKNDPQCHIDGDLNKDYVPGHNSEKVSPPVSEFAQCNDTKDNDEDKLADILDPNCHIGGIVTGEYIPTHFSEDTLPTQCSDTKDNDGDGKVDEKDPNCHAEGNLAKPYIPSNDSEGVSPTACADTVDNDDDTFIDQLDPQCHEEGKLEKPYVATHNSEKVPPVPANKCLAIDQNPLTFTDVEKAKLAELLRKFYLIAPTLKTEEDISMIYREIDNYKELIGRLDYLTNQCYAETTSKNGLTKNPTYTGPTTRYGNPWYKYNERGSYLTGGGASINVPVENSFCSGAGDIGNGDYNCANPVSQLYCIYEDPFGKNFINDCKWTPKVNLKEYEAILNIW